MDNYNKWQSFWDMFEFVVNRNIDISKSKKFTYSVFEELWDRCSRICNNIILLGCLLLKMILETVINILRDRFRKPQLLISYHIGSFVEIGNTLL